MYGERGNGHSEQIVVTMCSEQIVVIMCLTLISFQGEHNATYTVSKSDTGLKFQKIRHKHPVSNARASYVKVKVDNSPITCLITCIQNIFNLTV